jgi:hypothetical protein
VNHAPMNRRLFRGVATVREYLENWLNNTSRVNVTEGIQRQRETHVRARLVP